MPHADELPILHRTLKLPAGVWDSAKGRGHEKGKVVREVIAEALDSELMPLIQSLRELGLDGPKAKKLVRVPINDHIIGQLNHGRRRTGVAGINLLALCLHRYASRQR